MILTKKKEIAIFVKNDTILKFLEKYFKNKKIFNAHYFKTINSFRIYINENKPLAVIVQASLLKSISDKITGFPTIAIIAGNIKKGIESAVNYNVNRYICRPYHKIDLEYKLENVILESDLFEGMKNEIRKLEIITELMQLISSTLDPKEILFRIVKKISEIINVSRCSIVRVDWLHRNAFVVATYEDPNITGIKLRLQKYPEIMEALKLKKPVVIKDISMDPIMRKVKNIIIPLGVRSILVIPIVFREKVIGTLFLRTSKKIHTITENEIKILDSIASSSANALYNAFLFEQAEDEKNRLEKLAITDFLTGMYNIRYFYHRIIEEFSRCQRYDLPISCIMLDIDYFKEINDVYGHKTGDIVLKEFGQLLKRHSRKSDVLARYGGEEFIILLPQTPVEGAILEAERIRKFIREYRFRAIKDKKGLTVSIGIASYPHTKIKTHDDLISCSDDALFTAKRKGRDKVLVFGQ